MTPVVETLLAVLGLTGLVVGVPLAFWAWADRRPKGAEVPLSVLLEDDSDDMSDAEWVELRDRIPAEFIDYGSSMVHRDCLGARRDGRPVCEHCGPVLAAEREAS